jgi:hypothetical protein
MVTALLVDEPILNLGGTDHLVVRAQIKIG